MSPVRRPPFERREFLKLLLLALGAAACRRISAPLAGVEPSVAPALRPATATAPPPTARPVLEPGPADTPIPTASPAFTPSATPTSPPAPVPALVIDGHQDIAWNALEFGRDPLQSAYAIREREAGSGIPHLIGQRVTGLPEYLAGRVGIIFATLFVMPAERAYTGWTKTAYSSPRQAEQRANEQLRYYHQLAGQAPRLRLIRSKSDLEEVVAAWTVPPGSQEPPVGLVIAMEGADPVRQPSDLSAWFEAGLRILGPAWGATRYAGGTGAPGPLTNLGRQLLQEMANLNMILDLSHLSEAAFLEAVEAYPGAVIASHSNPRKFLPTDRGLSKDMILKLAGRDGVLGIIPYNRYLKPGWSTGQAREAVPLETVVEAIDYVVQAVGDAQHVAIGSDFDGGFGLESLPWGMDTAADLLQLAGALQNRGYREEDIDAIMYQNWLRILRRSLP